MRTRSGGRHLLFNHALGLRCSAGRVAPGVDVRADGGYVIWWPRAGLRVLSDAPVADWPGWLLELARPPSGAPAPLQIALNGLRAPGGVSTTRNLRKRTEHILRLVERAEEGTRNNRLFWAACRFGEMVAEGVIRETVAVQLLESAATLCGLVADDGMSRVRATIASGLERRRTCAGDLAMMEERSSASEWSKRHQGHPEQEGGGDTERYPHRP